MSIFGCVAFIAVAVGLAVSGATVAYRVSFDGSTIATVKSQEQFYSAVEEVADLVNGSGVEETVGEPQYTPVLVLDRELNTQEEVVQSIIENNDDIVSASVLTVNGETVVCVEEDCLIDYLEEYRSGFDLDGVECVSEFVDEISVETGYYLACDVDDPEDARNVISGLSVRTTANISTDVEVPYESIRKNISTQLIGYTGVSVEGKCGVNRVTESVTLLNGAEVERHEVETVVISEPVTEVIEVGTAKTMATPAERAAAYSSGFIFPLPQGVWVISSYYGDGRNHKGMDLACSFATSIYAVKSGTVVKAGYDNAYGYSVLIDHGNGLQTRYAHACQLAVSVGDTVSAGDVIAFVGSTGNSTGNHLHFEVLVNGDRVNPASYIGLD